MTTTRHFSSHLAHFILEGKMFQTKAVEKIKTHIKKKNLCYSHRSSFCNHIFYQMPFMILYA